MNKNVARIVAFGLLAGGSPAFAAGKACEELKAEIAAKLDAKKVAGYTLEIVGADKSADARVVGTCQGGAMKIVYARK